MTTWAEYLEANVTVQKRLMEVVLHGEVVVALHIVPDLEHTIVR